MTRADLVLIGVLGCVAACAGGPTAPYLADIQQAEAAWSAHHLTRYAYRYEVTGFLNAFAGQPIRLVVLGDTVRSAQFVGTGDSVPADPATFPTIDALFSLAIAARQGGTLSAVTFDSTLSYPARLELSGPPDASGAIEASSVEFLP